MDRKLTAILYADVAGYSRLTGTDEKGTHEALKTHLGALTEAIEGHGGRIVNTAGDALLAEFSSVVTALECAVAAQRDLAECDKDVPETRKFRFRIGVNLGDVIVDGAEIYGNGVNVAARLETLADAGGICISGRVQEQVEDKLDVGFAYLGAQSVKNIKKPVNVYKVLLDPADAGKTISLETPRTPVWRWPTAAAVTLVIFVLGGLATWLRPSPPQIEPASGDSIVAAPRAAGLPEELPLPDKPSIAVLPFDNLSEDKEQEYFADGMTDDLITRLSKVGGLFVIARNSTFAYKGKPVKVQDVARDLGVLHVLEGSVRKANGTIRINVQLIDARTGGHLWAEKFDRPYQDIFALQDEITALITSALSVTLSTDEQVRLARVPTGNLAAYETLLKAGQTYAYTGKELKRKLALFEKATELDPNFAEAHAAEAALAAFVYRNQAWGVIQPTPTHARARALEGVTRALTLDPESPMAHSTLGLLKLAEGKHDEALRLARKALSFAPNDANVRTALATILGYAGQAETAQAEMKKVVRLDPNPAPSVHIIDAFFYLIGGSYEQAIERLLKAKIVVPDNATVNTMLGAAYAGLGRMQEANDAIELALKREPNRAVSWLRLTFHYFKHPEDLNHLMNLYRKAGLPEWPLGFEGVERDRVTGAEIKNLLWGNRMEGSHDRGDMAWDSRWSITTDGTITYDSQYFWMAGTAWVEEDKLCTKIADLFFGRKRCVPIYRNPRGMAATTNEYVLPTAYSVMYFSVVE